MLDKRRSAALESPRGPGLWHILHFLPLPALALWRESVLLGVGTGAEPVQALPPRALLSDWWPHWCGASWVVADASVGTLWWLRRLRRAALSSYPTSAISVFSSSPGDSLVLATAAHTSGSVINHFPKEKLA